MTMSHEKTACVTGSLMPALSNHLTQCCLPVNLQRQVSEALSIGSFLSGPWRPKEGADEDDKGTMGGLYQESCGGCWEKFLQLAG